MRFEVDDMRQTSLRRIRNLEILGALICMVAAVIFHFAYDWFSSPFVALFSAVNESVWEHTKLVVMPYLMYAVFEWFSFGRENPPVFLKAKAVGVWSIPIFMISFYYTYTGIFSERSTVVDIISAFVWAAIAFLISFRIIKKGESKLSGKYYAGWSLLLLILEIFFTFFPPDIPLFISNV